MTLDDYDPPVPLWMVICSLLDGSEGLSGYKLAESASKLMGRYVRTTATSYALKRMVADGILEIVPAPATGRRMPPRVHRLTSAGRELYGEGLDVIGLVLCLERKHGNKKKRG